MPKHKKTREQKIKSDLRNVALQSTSGLYSFNASSVSHSEIGPHEKVATISLIKRDLVKTALVSSLIVFLQLLFFFLLKSHMLAMSFVRY